MGAVAAFSRSDLRNIARDPLLLYIAVLPAVVVILIRLVIPPADHWFASAWDIELATYYPLIATLFFLIDIPLFFGVVLGLLVLDERDEGILDTLRVTPLPVAHYAAYRIGLAVLVGSICLVICLLLSGLVRADAVFSVVPLAVVASLLAPAIGLFLATFAANKLEGLALMKGLGLLVLAPMAAYFVESDWQLLFGVLPTYWPAKAFWLASSSGYPWGHLAIGLVYNVLLTTWLLRRFAARASR